MRRLREIENPAAAVAAAERTLPVRSASALDGESRKGVYLYHPFSVHYYSYLYQFLRYKKERFEFGKVRPACAEMGIIYILFLCLHFFLDYTELPKETATMSPAQRRLLFTAQLEHMHANQLVRHEQAQLEKKAILRKHEMESGVLSMRSHPPA